MRFIRVDEFEAVKASSAYSYYYYCVHGTDDATISGNFGKTLCIRFSEAAEGPCTVEVAPGFFMSQMGAEAFNGDWCGSPVTMNRANSLHTVQEVDDTMRPAGATVVD